LRTVDYKNSGNAIADLRNWTSAILLLSFIDISEIFFNEETFRLQGEQPKNGLRKVKESTTVN
jgi:hypothetical protein